jgi:hypothetical protein
MTITHGNLILHMPSQGTTIFFEMSMPPTQQELDHSPHIIQTLVTEWNPRTVQMTAVQYAEAEDLFGGTEPVLSRISLTKEICQISGRSASTVNVEACKTFISKE